MKSSLLISHDLNMVAKHADQVVLLNKGVICSGTPEEVFADARTKHIFGLLAGETAREAAADIPECGIAETTAPMEGGERG